MKLYHFISLSLLLFIPAGLFIEKKFKIKRKFWCCHVNKFHKRGEIIIIMLIILALTAFTFLEAAPP
ncbi:MAG TPA: DUF4181 domain-containing protein, partial [Firmicutes bacterium]|nr:DUF4181 domain-containing protein [Bacillota bacterium]